MNPKRKQETARRSLKIVFLLLAVLLAAEILSPLPADARRRREEDLPNYFGLKAGLYLPADSGLDQSIAGEIVFGHKFNRYFGMEFGAGYTNIEGEYWFTGEKVEIQVIPLTLGFKGFFPVKSFEPFIEGGLGYYMTDFKMENRASQGENTIGYFFGGGLNYRITEGIMLGLEVKYVIVDPYSGYTYSFDYSYPSIDGLSTTVNLEFRF